MHLLSNTDVAESLTSRKPRVFAFYALGLFYATESALEPMCPVLPTGTLTIQYPREPIGFPKS